jgi:tetratricopeptide (TPR) repeat protein
VGFLIFPFLFFGWCLATHSADLAEGQAALLAGDYSGTVALAKKELADRPGDEGWQLLLSRALLTTGQYGEALTAMTNALARDPDSLPLRWQAREVFQSNGQSEAANQMTASIMRRFTADPRNYRDPASLVVFGQAALSQRADPKRVLDQLFETAKRADPKLRDVYLASGGLALEKHDFALAAKRFEEGLKQLPDDADLHYGLARAFAASDDSLMLDALNEALGRNSNHVGSLLLMADHEIDAEDYPEAEKLLARVQAINPWSPEALAYRAAAAHLQNQPEKEATARKEALKFWPDNPRVDYLIGLKLSQKYRFAEGSAHQRQALEYVDDYLPSKIQLAQDLLRLGEETEGWALAQEVSKQDGYDVEAYNLATLHDTMKSFATLTNQDFILRMGRHEAEVYGARVLDLLSRARSNLCAKFDFQVKRPTIVEVFPEQ